MTAKIIKTNNNYRIMKENGEYIGTIHAQYGIIPMEWDCKYNSIERVIEVAKDFWNIDIVE